MKLIKKLCTLCLIFVFSMLNFCACSKPENNLCSVSISKELSIELVSGKIVSQENNLIVVEKNTKIKPSLNALKETTTSENNLEIFNHPGICFNDKFFEFNTEFEITNNSSITYIKNYLEPIGTVLVQKTPNNSDWNSISDFKKFLDANLIIGQNNIESLNKFVFFCAITNSNDKNFNISSNTRCNVIKTENNLNFEVEIFFETTEIYSMLILKDDFGNFYLKNLKNLNISQNSTNIIEIKYLNETAENSIMISFSKNLSSIKK